MGWGIIEDAVDAVGDGLDKAEDVVEAGVDKVGDAVDFVVDLAEATLDECMSVLKGLVSLGDDAVEQVVRYLGLPWPAADEDKLRRMAAAYDRMAASLDGVASGAAPAARAVIAGNKGLPIDNFASFWNRYEGGPGAWLPGMAGSCRQQADSLRKLADAVEKQKTVLKAEILAVAATILVGVGLLFVPGVNVISGAAITAATNIARGAAMAAGLAISESVLAIIGSIAGSAVVGAVLSVTLDLAVAQPVKIALGAQDGITLDHLASTAAYGAGGGAFAAGFSSGAAQLPKLALPARLTPLAGRIPTALESLPGQTLLGAGGAATLDLATGNDVSLLNVIAGGAGGAGSRMAAGGRPGIGDVLAGDPGAPVVPTEPGGPATSRPLQVSNSARGSDPLTPEQIAEAREIAISMGMPEEGIVYSDNMNTAWSAMFGQERLYIGTDVLPGTQDHPNSQISLRGAIAHEVVGHREAELAGRAQTDEYLEEAQASLRAAELAPGLTPEERAMLRADAMIRLQHAGVDPKDFEPWMGGGS
ncbi:hypothetical protein [Embleya sp. MST-111070]|uniref:WXG100-like domain-containing protein n=1 Tax=Embleya sp. MST-111070 TaxID=3398231 RepID=UPI003F737223